MTRGQGTERPGGTVRERRARLEAMRARHQRLTSSAAAKAKEEGDAASEVPEIPFRMIQRGGQDLQRQMLVKVYQMLAQVRPEGAETVEGTPFSRVGVERLMMALTQRAQDPSLPGARAATGALRFLQARKDEPQVAGASIEKLKMLADRGAARRIRGGGRPA